MNNGDFSEQRQRAKHSLKMGQKKKKKKKFQHIYGANIVAEESHDDAGIQG